MTNEYTPKQLWGLCEKCEDVDCEWNCQYEEIMLILNTHTKEDQKHLLKDYPKDLLRSVKEKNKEFKARRNEARKLGYFY